MQQHEAEQRPQSESLRLRLLWELLHNPRWLAGMGLSILAFGLEGIALAFGPLTLVEPLFLTDLLFALPLAARRGGPRLGWRSVAGAALLAVGLAVLLTGADVGEAPPNPPAAGWIGAGIGVTALVVLCVTATPPSWGRRRALTLAVATAAAIGFQAALAQTFALALRADGVVATMVSWRPYALLVIGVTGLVLSQSMLQAGPLAASLPVLDLGVPVFSITIGVAALNQPLAASGGAVLAVSAGALACVAGVAAIERSPALAAARQVPAPSSPAQRQDPAGTT